MAVKETKELHMEECPSLFFSLFSIVLSQLIDTLSLHFYFVEGWVKLIC